MATINFSIDSAGNITPTATQSASASDTVDVSANKFRVYVYTQSGTPTNVLFDAYSIAYNEWPKTICNVTGVFVLSTCSNGLTCDEEGLLMEAKCAAYSNASVVQPLAGTRTNGTINVGGAR